MEQGMNSLEALSFCFNNPEKPLYYNANSYILKLEYTHEGGWICYFKVGNDKDWDKNNAIPMVWGWKE